MKIAIIGTGNIGTDLLKKIFRSKLMYCAFVIFIIITPHQKKECKNYQQTLQSKKSLQDFTLLIEPLDLKLFIRLTIHHIIHYLRHLRKFLVLVR